MIIGVHDQSLHAKLLHCLPSESLTYFLHFLYFPKFAAPRPNQT